MRYCYIKGDYNDANFSTGLFPVTKEEELEIKNLALKIKNKRHNYSGYNEDKEDLVDLCASEIYEGTLTEDELELLSEIVPYGDDSGDIHTIIQITFFDVENIDRAFTNTEYSGWEEFIWQKTKNIV